MQKAKREAAGLSMVLPVFNEIAAVIPEIRRILQVLKKLDCPSELIVVDDGSTDGTTGLLMEAGEDFRLICSEDNRGYGASLKRGIRQAKYSLVGTTDADGTYPSEDIPKLLEAMSDADMVVGARTGAKVYIPLIRRPAKWLLNKLANYLSNTDIPDLNSGLRIFRKEIAQHYFHILPDRFSFSTTITLTMLADGYRVKYVSINYGKREGTSKIRPSDAMGFFVLILRTITYFNPLRTFVPVFVFLFTLSAIKLLYDIFWLNNITDTTTLLFLMSLQVILIGVVADLIVKRAQRE